MRQKDVVRIVVATVILALVVICLVLISTQLNVIDSFDKCKAAGYPVQESYPERCVTPDGKSFTKPFTIGASVTYSGTMVCLPHKDNSGPVTLECAYGLLTADGRYHGLKDDNQLVFEMNIGDEVQVSGKIVEDSSSIYNIVDTVSVESIEKL